MQMPLGKEIGLGPGHTVLDGDPVGTKPHSSPSPLSAHAYCGDNATTAQAADKLICRREG